MPDFAICPARITALMAREYPIDKVRDFGTVAIVDSWHIRTL